jgi:hypothetical protein
MLKEKFMSDHITEEIRRLCFASKTRWVLYIPFEHIKAEKKPENFENIALNLKSFAMPEMEIKKASAHLNGEFMNLPSNVKAYSKEFAVTYIMSEDWHQFDLLTDYFNLLSDLEESKANYSKLNEITINPEFFVLTAFKKPIFSIKFYNTYLYKMGDLDFSYDDMTDEVVDHSVAFTYSHWTKHRFKG